MNIMLKCIWTMIRFPRIIYGLEMSASLQSPSSLFCRSCPSFSWRLLPSSWHSFYRWLWPLLVNSGLMDINIWNNEIQCFVCLFCFSYLQTPSVRSGFCVLIYKCLSWQQWLLYSWGIGQSRHLEYLKNIKDIWARETAQSVKSLLRKHKDLGSIPRTHIECQARKQLLSSQC